MTPPPPSPSSPDPHAVVAPGQRWVSETQPELGLALIVAADKEKIQAHYPAAGQTLTYSRFGAPLRRVMFQVGDTVRGQSGAAFEVRDIREEEGRLVYLGPSGEELPESELSDTISFQKPESRLLSGLVDPPRTWRLRQEALRQRAAQRQRTVRGLCGARISLIPHQLFIASEVAARWAPRVLLADEVGLGKTIEACLILHRLHLSGRARRILIVVPEALVHQWFVELYRRFQLSFSLFDEERALAIEAEGRHATGESEDEQGAGDEPTERASSSNPFFEEQLVLCSLDWLVAEPGRAEQAAAGEWDLLVVDEAHHLEWSPKGPGEAYQRVAAIAEGVPGLLLLTATPEQLGREGHFARLRLLDPARFDDLEAYLEESGRYREISRLADALRSERDLEPAECAFLESLLGADAANDLKVRDTHQLRAELVASLVDLHGTGRVMFRNRRTVLEGFPRRIAQLAPLEAKADATGGDTSPFVGPSFEARLDWLAALLKERPDDKFLLIGHSRELAEAIGAGLAERVRATAALFHEGLSIIERDRHAAWFAEEDGARILICSEIGSEGRNFQFVHDLVLFDLPEDPGLLEQRIGRLDRIGQEEDIQVHVPYIDGGEEALWARWYHEGLDAFQRTVHGAAAIEREFAPRLRELSAADTQQVDALIAETRAFRERLEHELEEGRDHLLEIASFDEERGRDLVNEIEDLDDDPDLEKFMLRLFDHFGVTVEDLEEQSFYISPEHLFSTEAFPDLPEEGLSLTFDRERALAREELRFVTWDSPMVGSAMDMLLASERGNAAFVKLEAATEQALMLEVVTVLECVAPESLYADRFLPPTPVRVLVDHEGKDRSKDYSIEMRRKSVPGPMDWLRKKLPPLKKVLPGILEQGLKLAEKEADTLRSASVAAMEALLEGEIERLEQLAELGHPVREVELASARAEREALVEHLSSARLRVDAVRLILAAPGR